MYHPPLSSYKFNDLELSDDETFKVVLRMFMDFNLVTQYQIPYKVRTLRKGYENEVMSAIMWSLNRPCAAGFSV